MITILPGLAPGASPLAEPYASMFEDRRRLFVDLMGWDVPVSAAGHEIDQFDHEDTVYVVELGDDGRHRGSIRLLPTTRPHILGELFPQLVKGPVPSGAHVMEITRLCLPTRLTTVQRLHVRNRLISAMVDYCLGAGVSGLTGVVRPNFRNLVAAMGWRAELLGPVAEVGDTLLGAFRIDLDEDTRNQLALSGIYTAGLLPAMFPGRGGSGADAGDVGNGDVAGELAGAHARSAAEVR